MDLRSMLNSETAGNANNPPSDPQQSPSAQSTRKPSDAVYSPREQVPAAAPASSASYPVGGFPGGSLQRTHVSPERTSSYGSLQSPYQYHPPAGRSAGAQSARGQSPQPAQYGSSRDSSFNAPQQRSQSIQSVLSHDTPMTHPSHPKESPSAAGIAPGYPSQQFSPPGPGSLPGTPRGSTAAYPQPSPSSVARPPSSGQEASSNRASSPWIGQEASMQMSPTAMPRLSRPRDQTPRPYSGTHERGGSEDSVSPKTTRAPSYADLSAPTQSTPDQNGMTVADAHVNSSPHEPPKRKRRRFDVPPIYAMRPERTKGRGPIIPNPFPPIPKHARDSPANPWLLRQRAASAAQGPAHAAAVPVSVKAPTDSLPSKPAVPPASRAPPTPAPVESQKPGSLGPWEPSITGAFPYEEVTKLVCDFLFRHVVVRNDAIAAPAGAAAAGPAPIIEVEAKLGQLIDMDRGDRVQLPILTETVINKQFPRFRTAFESSMTVAQHRAMNNFLNEAVKRSLDQADRPRIPISYAHKKERDTFYEVSPHELPPVIRQNLNPRHKPKVRVTVDQRTNEVLAKIVKCRIADLDVHSPHTCVDWRISVNLEMNYDGDVSQLTVIDPARGHGGDRNKDRMSYRHLAYQIDLTQVAKSDSAKGDFEHELEVEISAAEIRRQGQMAMNGEPHQYEDLVKGFLDNVRVLARQVPP
ncbi:putative mRNA capping nucleoside-triphosphatase [Aspergillus homomorphus CBS 101889]|uniref:mRNA-capping enzyme subunit beta n=1 Tax=Aspergillus homomorphus (strain CBS 101889) TaxID=1450537 RepID=A0A395I781_ASPHC|nr:mRNA triphosphatase CET1 [Aspergillus homomorphus CBS 101889]RAL15981.1 mRNA triphosphatase CET1 [Aspergillus homomorphus CBS 101889]